MPVEKGKRNALVVRLWSRGGSNQEILTALKRAGYKDVKDTHSLSGVISRLKRAGKLLRERPGVARKVIGVSVKDDKLIRKQITKTTNQQVYKRATFYIEPSMLKTLKLLAVKRDKKLSEIVREAFLSYLSKQTNL